MRYVKSDQIIGRNSESDVVDLEGVHRTKLFKSMDTLAVLSRQVQSVEAALSDQVTGVWH